MTEKLRVRYLRARGLIVGGEKDEEQAYNRYENNECESVVLEVEFGVVRVALIVSAVLHSARPTLI
jgi:hypothetical protein